MQHANFLVPPVAHSRLAQVDFDNFGFGTVQIANAIITEAALSFLGLGMPASAR
jgi:hypothetical protein